MITTRPVSDRTNAKACSGVRVRKYERNPAMAPMTSVVMKVGPSNASFGSVRLK